MQLFFAPDIDNDEVELSGDEARHCLRALRLAVGDELFLTDGAGSLCRARLVSVGKADCLAHIVERLPDPHPRSHYLHLAIAPTKNADRIEWLVEKATELGIDRISLISSQFTERQHINFDRLSKLAVSAMKQSLQTRLPLIDGLLPASRLFAEPFSGSRLVCHCLPDVPRLPLSQVVSPASRVQLFIGPEGDFSPDEVALALDNGFQSVSLGSNRLRTETAALAVVSFVNMLNA